MNLLTIIRAGIFVFAGGDRSPEYGKSKLKTKPIGAGLELGSKGMIYTVFYI